MDFLLLTVHIGTAAMWLGSMGYSLFNVQPALARMAGGDPSRIEDMQRELAHGNRWRVVGLIVLLWLSGIGLVLRHPGHWPSVFAKAVLLLIASVLFWWVSWRGWPQRVFALPEELPALQRRFRRIAIAMFALVGAAFVLSLATWQ